MNELLLVLGYVWVAYLVLRSIYYSMEAASTSIHNYGSCVRMSNQDASSGYSSIF